MKVLKWIGIVLGGLIVIVAVAFLVLFVIGGAKFDRIYAVAMNPAVIPEGEEAVASGQHIAITRGCADCHGPNLGGTVFINEPSLAVLPAPNLTPGVGGVGDTYTDEDWVRAIRHGIGAGGRGLLIMPSQYYTHLSDDDLGALIAYLKQLEPVDNDLPPRQIGTMGRILLATNQLPPPAPGLIAPNMDRTAPPAGETAEYGEYLVLSTGCQDCHGQDLAGAVPPGSDPGTPLSPSLTPAGDLAGWTQEGFVEAMRTGVTPEGESLNGEEMPWPAFAQFTDTELGAIWAYLESLPPTASSGG
jgi:mono/diheme cytochrome c family protein